jgi:hypothetical protein
MEAECCLSPRKVPAVEVTLLVRPASVSMNTKLSIACWDQLGTERIVPVVVFLDSVLVLQPTARQVS